MRLAMLILFAATSLAHAATSNIINPGPTTGKLVPGPSTGKLVLGPDTMKHGSVGAFGPCEGAAACTKAERLAKENKGKDYFFCPRKNGTQKMVMALSPPKGCRAAKKTETIEADGKRH
jgi:hypothetical protein